MISSTNRNFKNRQGPVVRTHLASPATVAASAVAGRIADPRRADLGHVAEMVAVKSGLGYVLWDAYYVGRMDIVIADMVSIGLIGFLSDWVLVRLEFWALRWRRLQSFGA